MALKPRNCISCNKIFYPLTAQVNMGRGKLCSPICRHKYQSVVMKGRIKSLSTCKKLSKALKGRIRSKAHSINISKSLTGKFFGSSNGNWKGGKYKSQGRWYIRQQSHPSRHQNGYILLSHFVTEQSINRFLKKEEHIHHINFKKDDDRIENLYIFPKESDHARYHNHLRTGKVSLITQSNLSNYQ